MAGKPKEKPKARPARPRGVNKKPAINGARITKRSASRSTPSARGSASKTPSSAASPAPQSGLKREDGGASTPESEAVMDFYAHMEAASDESSRWDTDSMLGAMLEDLTDETGTPGGEFVILHLLLFIPCRVRLSLVVQRASLVVSFSLSLLSALFDTPSIVCLLVLASLLLASCTSTHCLHLKILHRDEELSICG